MINHQKKREINSNDRSNRSNFSPSSCKKKKKKKIIKPLKPFERTRMSKYLRIQFLDSCVVSMIPFKTHLFVSTSVNFNRKPGTRLCLHLLESRSNFSFSSLLFSILFIILSVNFTENQPTHLSTSLPPSSRSRKKFLRLFLFPNSSILFFIRLYSVINA